jgi:hypothetical protein
MRFKETIAVYSYSHINEAYKFSLRVKQMIQIFSSVL